MDRIAVDDCTIHRCKTHRSHSSKRDWPSKLQGRILFHTLSCERYSNLLKAGLATHKRATPNRENAT